MNHPLTEIRDKGGDAALDMVATLMDQSAREREWVERAVQTSFEAERDYWKNRALAAEAHYRSVERRITGLLLGPGPEDWES